MSWQCYMIVIHTKCDIKNMHVALRGYSVENKYVSLMIATKFQMHTAKYSHCLPGGAKYWLFYIID